MASGEYMLCPNCGNIKDGTKIYKCNSCNTVFCYSCADRGWGDKCPKCGTDYGGVLRPRISNLGKIIRN